jgi:outer membrane protein assembly factor BamB
MRSSVLPIRTATLVVTSVATLVAALVVLWGAPADGAPLVSLTGSSPELNGPSISGADVAAARGGLPAAGLPGRGWPFPLSEPIASPFFEDVNGDGTDEVIIADGQRAYVLDPSGLPLPGWPRTFGSRVDNCGAAGDLDGDGQIEIAFGVEGAPPRLYVLNASGADEPGWPASLPYQYWLNCSSPVFADLDQDGDTDVGIGVETGVAFLDAQGQSLPGWPFLWMTNQNLAWSAPAVGDIDGDGKNEVVVGENSLYASGVYAIRADGTLMPGWPQSTGPCFSSPSLADLDGDGVLEVIAQDGTSTWLGHQLYVWNGDGTSVPGFPRSLTAEWNGSRANPAIGDLDGDGTLEIVTVSSDGLLHVVRPNGTNYPGYPKLTPASELISSPQLADVDSDGFQEIFLAYATGNGAQYVSGWKLRGTVLPGFPKMLLAASQLAVHGSTDVKDIDHDGLFEIVACGTDFSKGTCCLFTVDQSSYDPATTRCEWPKIRRDAANSGLYARIDPADAAEAGGVPCRLGLCIAPNPAEIGSFVRFYIPLDEESSGGTGPGRAGLDHGRGGRFTIFDASGRAVPAGFPILDGAGTPAAGQGILPERIGTGVYFVRYEPAAGGASRTARLVVTRN